MSDHERNLMRAGQVFHNLIDSLVKLELDSSSASEVDLALANVERECERDVDAQPGDIVEIAWLETIRALRMYCSSVATDATLGSGEAEPNSEPKPSSSFKPTVVSLFKNAE